MDRARWAGSNWPNILESRALKLAAQIEFGLIGPTQISPEPIRVTIGPNFYFFIINFF